MLRRLRADPGQASLDYLTVLVVTGLLLGAGTGVAMAQGGGIAGAVTTQVVRALCIVSGGDCDRDRAPCVVGSTGKTISGSLSLAVVRLGRDQLALVEERSDGRFDVTLVRGWNPGLEGGVGLKLKIPKTGLAFQGELRAAVLAHLRKGRSWTVGSAAEADALVGTLGGLKGAIVPEAVRGGTLPEPDRTFEESGWSTTIGLEGVLDPAKVRVELSAADFDGARRDRRTGHVTHYLKRSQEFGAALERPTDDGKVGGELDYVGGYVWAIETDRRGRPVDLMIVESDEYRGTASLPDEVAEVAGHLGVPGKIAERYEVERHLDLTVPANLRAAMQFVSRVLGPFKGATPFADRVAVSDALRDRLDRFGVVHARTYETEHASDGGGATLAAGLKIGAGYETSVHTSKLLAATTRGPGGTWRSRTDCG